MSLFSAAKNSLEQRTTLATRAAALAKPQVAAAVSMPRPVYQGGSVKPGSDTVAAERVSVPAPVLTGPILNPIPSRGEENLPIGAVPPGEPVSLLSEFGRITGQVAKVGGAFLSGGPIAGTAALASTLTSRTSPSAAMPQLAGQFAGIGSLASTLGKLTGKAGTIGGIVGLASSVIPSGGSGGCGCNGSKGRDPCTHQKLSAQRAPEATFFGGCCPPGRRLIRRPWARDICGKIPKMNPFNPRALARADQRLTSFARRSTVMLRDMGFHVERHRKVKLSKGRKRARR